MVNIKPIIIVIMLTIIITHIVTWENLFSVFCVGSCLKMLGVLTKENKYGNGHTHLSLLNSNNVFEKYLSVVSTR